MTVSVNRIPSVSVPFTDKQGRISPIWHEFLRSFVASSLQVGDAADGAAVSVIAGGGLTGGGTLTADRTLAVGAGSGIAVNADSVSVDITNQTFTRSKLEDEVMVSDVTDNNTIKKTRVRDIAALAANPGGSDTQVQYNSSGVFGGDSGFTYNGSGTTTLSTAMKLSTNYEVTNTAGVAQIFFDAVTGSTVPRIQSDGGGGYTLHALPSGSNEARLNFSSSAPTITYTVGNNTGTVVISSTEGFRLSGTTMPLRRALTTGITASTTQTQGNGALTADYNSVDTVANANDTVTLPAALSGRYCVVINNGVNTLQIFPASGANLGAGTNTAITLRPGSRAIWLATTTTLWYQVEGVMRNTVVSTISASTTQTQGNGALTADVNEISVVANANDTVTLPTAPSFSRTVTIINNGANTLKIFPASGDDLGAGLNTSSTLAAGSNVMYTNYNATNWEVV